MTSSATLRQKVEGGTMTERLLATLETQYLFNVAVTVEENAVLLGKKIIHVEYVNI